MMNIDRLREFIQPYCSKKDVMHNLCHIERILKSVEKLLKNSEYSVDMKIITYAAYFHGFIYNSEKELVDWLKAEEFSEDEINKIVKVAWETRRDKVPNSIEGKVLHDAHMIEGEKTYLVVKALIVGCSNKQTIEETVKYIEDNLIDNGMCYLPESKKFYVEQQDYAKEFINGIRNKV